DRVDARRPGDLHARTQPDRESRRARDRLGADCRVREILRGAHHRVAAIGMAAVSFESACALIETALQGGARRDILEGVSASNDFTQALRRLRAGMRANAWKAFGQKIDLDE